MKPVCRLCAWRPVTVQGSACPSCRGKLAGSISAIKTKTKDLGLPVVRGLKGDNVHSELQATGADAAPVTELAVAEAIARNAHAGQKCTVTGEPYIRHIERVVAMVDGDEAKAVAWLHDVLEDTDVTSRDLARAGLSDAVIDSVEDLTRSPDDSYSVYILSLVTQSRALARTVKLADLRDHIRPDCPARLRPRYLSAWLTLTGEEFGEAPSGDTAQR